MSSGRLGPAARSDASATWLLGRGADLFIGCGLAYLLSIPFLLLVSMQTGAEVFPSAAIVLVTIFLNGPHYGATLLRVYDEREARRKYAFFAVYVTSILVAALVVATWNVWVASLLLTAYVAWSPWHFSGQNYGLMLMFLRRRGVEVDASTKRLLYASFVLSAALAVLAIQTGFRGAVFAPSTLQIANVPDVLTLDLTPEWSRSLLVSMFVAYLVCLVLAGLRLFRNAGLRTLTPAFLLVVNQALWFTIPAILASLGRLDGPSLVFAAVWVNAAHSAQYLWVTSYYAKRTEARRSVRNFLGRAFVAGTAVTMLPAMVLAPHMLGGLPWDAGLAAVLFSAVNLHHFVLDGAIWKLRDGRVAQVLLRRGTQQVTPASPLPSGRSRWPGRLVWALAGCSLVVPILIVGGASAVRFATRGVDADRAVAVLRWVGRETTEIHVRLGDRYLAAGNQRDAIRHYRRSIELFPTGRAWSSLGILQRNEGDWEAALASFDAASALTPGLFRLPLRRAEALLALDAASSSHGRRAEAIRSLEEMLEIEPGHAESARLLASLQAEGGDVQCAIDILEAALVAASPRDKALLHDQLAIFRR